MAESEQLHAFVYGRVQGVGFRAFTQRRASELGLVGFARNLSDGASVEVVAEGPRPALESLLAHLRVGPSAGRVEHVDSSWAPAAGHYERFGTR